jgi:prepilin-type N-terminal cleavage/methylation domain-containing protein
MICGSQKQYNTRRRPRERASRGFTLLELMLVIGVGMVLAAIAIPVVQNSLRVYNMRAATSSLAGAISSTRFQAIFNGCKSQIVFNQATYSYQIQSEAPAFGGQLCTAAFANVGGVVPLQGKGMALNANITLTFSPSGSISSIPAANPIRLILTNTSAGVAIPAETIQVSTYGNVTVTP